VHAFVLALLLAAPIQGETSVTSSSPKAAELFRAGREKLLDLEGPRGQKLLREALNLDPDFPLALAWLGRAVGGAEGLKLAEHAASLQAPLPEGERLQIAIILAERRGEESQARHLKRELADLAPDDWMPQLLQGVQAQYDRKSQSAMVYLKRCLALNPKQAAAYNTLAYVYLAQGMVAEAVDAAQKLTALRPEDSNPQDSLGEMLLRAGRFDEADAAFARSVTLAPDNWMGRVGRAYVRFFRGQIPAGEEMLKRARASTESAQARMMIDVTGAWVLLALGDGLGALHAMDAMERSARTHKDDLAIAWAALERGEILEELGSHAEARAQIDQAFARSAAAKLPGEDVNRLRRLGLLAQQRAALAAGDQAGAAAVLTEIDAFAASAQENPLVRNAAATAHGLAEMAAGRPQEAIRSLERCNRNSFRCQWILAEAQERAGNRTAAGETRNWIATANTRDTLHHNEDPVYFYLRERLVHPKDLTASR
jgi:Flp pilus assembly protein TadD